MFCVCPATAKSLYRAQFPHLRGRLRLDISSRRFPADPTRPLDVSCAVEAIGERLVGLLISYGFDRPPDPMNPVQVMPGPTEFEPFVVPRIDHDFGLDPLSKVHSKALSCLARDFHGWVKCRPQESEPWFQVGTPGEEVSVKCNPYTDKDLGLEDKDLGLKDFQAVAEVLELRQTWEVSGSPSSPDE